MQNLNRKKNQQVCTKYNLGNQDLFTCILIQFYSSLTSSLLLNNLYILTFLFLENKPSDLKQTYQLLGDKYWGDCVGNRSERDLVLSLDELRLNPIDQTLWLERVIMKRFYIISII